MNHIQKANWCGNGKFSTGNQVDSGGNSIWIIGWNTTWLKHPCATSGKNRKPYSGSIKWKKLYPVNQGPEIFYSRKDAERLDVSVILMFLFTFAVVLISIRIKDRTRQEKAGKWKLLRCYCWLHLLFWCSGSGWVTGFIKTRNSSILLTLVGLRTVSRSQLFGSVAELCGRTYLEAA